MAEMDTPRLLVFSSLFPKVVQPFAGVFIRERMFRVGKVLPIVVVSPVAWFPLQGLMRFFKPHYRPMPPKYETQDGVAVFHPRFLSVPSLFRSLDGFMMALACWPTLRRIKRDFGFNIIDAHFAYPDGYAATWLGRWFGVPVTITLRGTEMRHAQSPALRHRMIMALQRATKVFSVSESLKHHAVSLGIQADKIQVVGNGVDLKKFHPENKQSSRQKYSLSETAPVLISVGGLVERKGFHRVLDCLPALREQFPDIRYLIVGGASPEGDMRAELEARVLRLGLSDNVKFLGAIPSADLRWPLSAADVFVLATRNEGWANVFLEAMACGLPVVTTDVGGNREVVCRDALGMVVPFGDQVALRSAMTTALSNSWDRSAIQAYATDNSWTQRVDALVQTFQRLHSNETRDAHELSRAGR